MVNLWPRATVLCRRTRSSKKYRRLQALSWPGIVVSGSFPDRCGGRVGFRFNRATITWETVNKCGCREELGARTVPIWTENLSQIHGSKLDGNAANSQEEHDASSLAAFVTTILCVPHLIVMGIRT